MRGEYWNGEDAAGKNLNTADDDMKAPFCLCCCMKKGKAKRYLRMVRDSGARESRV